MRASSKIGGTNRQTDPVFALVAAIGVTALSTSAYAQPSQNEVLAGVRLDQRVGETVSMDVPFVDERGSEVTLASFVGDGPVVLVPVFYRCPMLCTQILNAMVRTTAGQSFNPGQEFTIVVFSIDPRETPELAVEKKLQYLEKLPRPAARNGWHFLVGGQTSIDRVTESIGYGYVYDKERDQFAHPAAVAVLTPDGVISRYLVGLDFSPNDLHLSLVEASNGRIGGIVEQVLLRCYQWDPERGRYGFAIMTTLRAGGVLTLALLAAAICWMTRRRSTGNVKPETVVKGEA